MWLVEKLKNIQTSPPIRGLLSLLAVCLTILITVRFLKFLHSTLSEKGKKDRQRLSVKEIFIIDPQHRLILVQRDNTEHLILLGDTPALLVEKNIPLISQSTYQENQNREPQIPQSFS